MHMLLILLALCLRKPNEISHLFSIAYSFSGNGWHVVLVTANRNDAGPESLESTIQHQNTPQSLPVFTLANDQRVLRDRQYAETVADRLIEALFDIDSYRGIGRIYLP